MSRQLVFIVRRLLLTIPMLLVMSVVVFLIIRLVPGDPVLEVSDRRVAVTGEYQGHRRMTLTYPELERSRRVFWLVTGEEKREPLGWLLAGDSEIPAGRVLAEDSQVIADQAACGKD